MRQKERWDGRLQSWANDWHILLILNGPSSNLVIIIILNLCRLAWQDLIECGARNRFIFYGFQAMDILVQNINCLFKLVANQDGSQTKP